MSDKIFIAGYPGVMGGANTEALHTAKMFAENGIAVEWIPTWGRDDDQRAKLDALGQATHHVEPKQLANIPGIKGSIVISFCNSRFLAEAARFRKLGCRVVWVNCMTFLFDSEQRHMDEHGLFDAFVFQSEFQRGELVARLARWALTRTDDERCHLIRGAFSFDDWPFEPRPHGKGEEFVIGRIARPDADKWSSNLWPIYNAIPYDRKRARLMGWTSTLTKKCGQAPKYAHTLAPQSESPQEFFSQLHATLPINGGAKENWPRAGLEAMAAGVPIVAQNEWGWKEMVEHGASGYLGSTDKELAYYAARLAYDEDHRMEVAHAGRKRVEQLADSQEIASRWLKLFSFLGSDIKPARAVA